MEEIQTESWDFKKILVGLILFVILFFGFKVLVLDKRGTRQSPFRSVNVQGTSTQANPSASPQSSLDLKKDVENKLNDLKREVNNINVVEIATSTPAVKKVINDLKNLQNLPQSQAKDACLKICNGL